MNGSAGWLGFGVSDGTKLDREPDTLQALAAADMRALGFDPQNQEEVRAFWRMKLETIPATRGGSLEPPTSDAQPTVFAKNFQTAAIYYPGVRSRIDDDGLSFLPAASRAMPTQPNA